MKSSCQHDHLGRYLGHRLDCRLRRPPRSYPVEGVRTQRLPTSIGSDDLSEPAMLARVQLCSFLFTLVWLFAHEKMFTLVW